MNYQPLENKIIVKRAPVTNKLGTLGIIESTDKGKERPREGKVMAIGPGKLSDKTGKRAPMTVKVGDKILFMDHAGNKLRGEEDLWVMAEDYVFGVLS